MKIKERGWPAHFIAADRCLFFRNTLVEHEETKIVVSTIGRWLGHNDEVETIGHNRYFETMAFYSKEDKFDDAITAVPLLLDGKVAVDHATPEADIEANEMHDNRVKEVKRKLKRGFHEN